MAHALLISLVIGARPLCSGSPPPFARPRSPDPAPQATISPAEITRQNRSLSLQEAKLKRILARKPTTAGAAAAAPAQRMIYVRPKPHIVTVHRAHGEEREAESRDREGGGLDD